jgi:predicted SprT family Zn-dependent metalloprotease
MTVHDMLLKLRNNGFDVMVAMKCVSNRPDIKDAPVIKAKFRRKAGVAKKYHDGSLEIRLASKLWLLPGEDAWAAIHSTFLHELAHLFTYDLSSHGALWQNYCQRFGIPAERYHNYETLQRAAPRAIKIVAQCLNCDQEILRRKRLPRNRNFRCKCGGDLIRF